MLAILIFTNKVKNIQLLNNINATFFRGDKSGRRVWIWQVNVSGFVI